MSKLPNDNLKTIWRQDKEWKGNPDLGYLSYTKMFRHHNRKIPVSIVGGLKNEWWYCVSAGANSDLSHSGFCIECSTIEKAKAYVNAKYNTGKLIN